MSANSFMLNTFLVAADVAAPNATGFAHCSILELDWSTKSHPIEIQENADTLRDNDAFSLTLHSYFCINGHIWYLINSPDGHLVILALTTSLTLRKQYPKLQNIISSNSTFYNLSTDISFVMVFLKLAHTKVKVCSLSQTNRLLWKKYQ